MCSFGDLTVPIERMLSLVRQEGRGAAEKDSRRPHRACALESKGRAGRGGARTSSLSPACCLPVSSKPGRGLKGAGVQGKLMGMQGWGSA